MSTRSEPRRTRALSYGAQGTLLSNNSSNTSVSKRKRCAYNIRLLNSKGVILVLMWNILVFSYQNLVLGTLVRLFPGLSEDYPWKSITLTIILQHGVPYLIYPIAGWIADAKIGRYKVIRVSLWLIWIGALLFLGTRIIYYALSHVIGISILSSYPSSSAAFTNDWDPVAIVCTVLIYIFNVIGIAGFQANIIPFGVDQMEDGSSDQYSAFIHWYYWTRNGSFGVLATLLIQSIKGYCEAKENPELGTELTDRFDLIILLLQVGCVTLAVCLDLLFSNHVLNKDPKVHNPLKKVWKVSKFVLKHDSFVGYREAMTYTYDDRLYRSDFARRAYGGPFDSDEVEDVMTFWKILVFIFSLGLGGVFLNDAVSDFNNMPACINFTATDYFVQVTLTFRLFVNHLHLPGSRHFLLLPECTVRHTISQLVYPLTFTVFIPFYEIFVYPFFRKYIPPMKVRVAAGMICMLLAAIGIFVIDAIGHSVDVSVCMMYFSKYHPDTLKHLDISMAYVIPLVILMALGEMLAFISGD